MADINATETRMDWTDLHRLAVSLGTARGRGRVIFKQSIMEIDCRRHPDALFVFGDNLAGWGKKGQSVIRDEPNAIGVVTKRYPSHENDTVYLTNDDATNPELVARLSKAFITLRQGVENGIDVYLPAGGLGTGHAQLPTRAPRVYRMIAEGVHKLIRLAAAAPAANSR